MTKFEEAMVMNLGEHSFRMLSKEAQAVFEREIERRSLLVQQLTNDGRWVATTTLGPMSGAIYRIQPEAEREPRYKEYNVYVSGADDVYCFDSGRSIVMAQARKGFAGIQYEGSDTWQETLNLVKFGIPTRIRFKK